MIKLKELLKEWTDTSFRDLPKPIDDWVKETIEKLCD